MTATTAFFEELGRHGYEPFLKAATGTVRFDLDDGGVTEHWLVTVDKGDIVVSQENATADCVVSADRELFDVVVDGEMSTLAMLLRGAMTVEGDRELHDLFQQFFRSPPNTTLKPRGHLELVGIGTRGETE